MRYRDREVAPTQERHSKEGAVRNLEEIGEIGETPYQKPLSKGNTSIKNPQQKPYRGTECVYLVVKFTTNDPIDWQSIT